MNTHSKQRLQSIGIWSGVLYVVGIVGGWGFIARFILPPHSPTTPASDIVKIYQEHTTSIRIGMVVVMFAALLAIFFSASIAHCIAKVEGGVGVLTFVALLGGAGLAVLTFYPATFWLVAAYRPDRAPDLIYLLNDLSWLQFIGGVTMFLALPIAVAIAAFCDTSTEPVFPRWAGYYNAWSVILILPDQLLFFFHTGPFAWNGIFGLWIPAASFGVWFLVTAHLLRKDLHRDGSLSADYAATASSSATSMINGTSGSD